MSKMYDEQTWMKQSRSAVRKLAMVGGIAVGLIPCDLAAQEPDYFPLHVGDFWRYEETCLDYSYEWTREIVGLDTIQGFVYHIAREDFPRYGQVFFRRLRKDEENQVWVFFERDGVEYLKYRLSAQVGESWEYGNFTRMTLTRRSEGDLCGTSFRQFTSCLEFEFDNGAFTGYEILADSVGRISETGEGCFNKMVGALVNGVEFGNPAAVSGLPTGVESPSVLTLHCLPNPFNSATTIRYHILSSAESKLVTIRIYDLLGRLVRTLVNDAQGPGIHTVAWDGRDDLGNEVASGVYLVRMQVGNFVQARKMTLMR